MEARTLSAVPANAPPARKLLPVREHSDAYSAPKQRNFEKIAGVAKRLSEKGFSPIVGSLEVYNQLKGMGLDPAFSPFVANENEIILNRARDSAESNFFVFMEYDAFKATSFFTNPSGGREGRALTREQLMRKSVSRTKDEKPEDWVDGISGEILEISEKKAQNTFYSINHGHWGENNDNDDGVSTRKEIIRQFMLWHIDVDATGYHNYMDFWAIADIAFREKSVGILKVPSFEFTIPFGMGALSDPHFNIWIADLETAEDMHRRFLEKRSAKFPGMAPDVDKRTVMRYINAMRKEDKLALGVAHPSCVMNVGIPLRMGILNLLSAKDRDGKNYTWKTIRAFIKKYADAVAACNPTLEDCKLRFKQSAVQKYFEKEIWEQVSKRIGRITGDETQEVPQYMHVLPGQMRENNVNMAVSMAMKRDHGKISYFDHDTHNYASIHYARAVSPLGYGRNTITFKDKGAFEALKESGGLTSQDFVKIMRKKQYKGHQVQVGMDTFLELHKGRLRPVKGRRGALYGFFCLKKDMYHTLITAKYAILEAARRIKNAIRPPPHENEGLEHARENTRDEGPPDIMQSAA